MPGTIVIVQRTREMPDEVVNEVRERSLLFAFASEVVS